MSKYVVYRVYRDNYRKDILFADLTREEALAKVRAVPNHNDHMVVFDKQPEGISVDERGNITNYSWLR